MISQSDFEAAIESFMMEMSAICVAKSEKELRALPGFFDELNESAALMQAAASTPARLLPLSFGVIDEFVEANRAEVIRECYELYLNMNHGASARHPRIEG
jgi:hypothetical protein